MEIIDNYKKLLLDSIPVVQALGVDIESLSTEHVTVSAPLDNNLNYEGTAFGGSLNTVAILSCYMMAHHLLKIHQVKFDSLVIQNSCIDYHHPVQGDFKAMATVSPQESQKFILMMQKKGIGRIQIQSTIHTDESKNPLVTFEGRFVAKV
jgi:thioesterase domain-containing protein